MLSHKLQGTFSGASKITYVGGTTGSTLGNTTTWTVSLTSLSGGTASSPAADDLVIVYYGMSTQSSNLSISATGYTQVTKLYVSDNYAANLYVGYKFMGATPDTDITLSATGDSRYAGTVAIQVWRNVDLVLPFDKATVTATGANSVLANPSSITPNTTNAIIVAGGIGGHGAGTQTFSSSDLTNFLTKGADDTYDSTVGLGYKEWTSGAFDPAAFTFSGTDSAAYSWCAVTMALRPKQAINTAPVFVESATNQNAATGSSLIINKPTGTQQNDLMIAFMTTDSGTSTWTGDTSWTEIADQGTVPNIRIAYKVAGASEGSSYTFTSSISTQILSGAILTYRGAAYDAIGSIVNAANPLVPTGPTAAADWCRLIGFASRAASTTITSTMTQRLVDPNGNSPNWFIGDKIVIAGATGTESFTVGSTSSVAAVLLTIKPA